MAYRLTYEGDKDLIVFRLAANGNEEIQDHFTGDHEALIQDNGGLVIRAVPTGRNVGAYAPGRWNRVAPEATGATDSEQDYDLK